MTGSETTTFMQVDVISLLRLEKDLSKREIHRLSDTFTAELVFRLLDETLPSLLTAEERTRFRTDSVKYKTLNDVFSWFRKYKPEVNMDHTLAQIISNIKREFAYDYLLRLKQETQDIRKEQQIQTALNMINNREATPASITSVINALY